MVWVYALTSTVVVSLVSLIGIFALLMKKKILEIVIPYLVALSAGALIGGAMVHLLPHSFSEFPAATVSAGTLSGILLFFALEKFLRWRHCHDVDCDAHPKHLGIMNLVGDAFHNLIDGILIGVSYLASIPLGITTTVAVVVHEVPQELGDFGVLLHSGFSKKKALLFNFMSAATAILGAAVAIFVGDKIEGFADFLLPLTAGGFIYIASSGLIPELHKEQNMKKSFYQFISLIVGMVLMYLLLFLE